MLSSFVFLSWAALAAAAPAQDQQSIPRTLVPEPIYAKLVKYAGYPRLSDNQTCPHPSVPGKLCRFVESTETDTQVAIWKVDKDKEFIVAVPGSNGFEDFLTDWDFLSVPYSVGKLYCASCLVHDGFQSAWISVMNQVQGNLTDLLQKNPDYTVTLSGHSLGGALVAIAFPSLRSGPYNVTQAYTYGQPRTGNQAFANYVDTISGASDTETGIYYRVTHANDNIPKVPLKYPDFYWHSRTEYWESRASMDNQGSTYRCYGQEPADCNGATPFCHSDAHTTYAGMNVTCGIL